MASNSYEDILFLRILLMLILLFLLMTVKTFVSNGVGLHWFDGKILHYRIIFQTLR